MSKYERGSGVPLSLMREDQGGEDKRYNLGLILPLGGMIVVGIVSLSLGLIFYDKPKPDNEPLDLPTMEDFEKGRLRDGEMRADPVREPRRPMDRRLAPDAGPEPLDSGPE